jgi:hypothetical protein
LRSAKNTFTRSAIYDEFLREISCGLVGETVLTEKEVPLEKCEKLDEEFEEETEKEFEKCRDRLEKCANRNRRIRI